MTDTAVISGFAKVVQIPCSAAGTADDVEVLTTGGTSLRYDTTSGQFINNWQTPKKPGNCYLVTMTTQYLSKLSGFFKLK